MRRITASNEAWAGEVAAFIGSDEWVDMKRVQVKGKGKMDTWLLTGRA